MRDKQTKKEKNKQQTNGDEKQTNKQRREM
jgi:hypothetical protein